MFVVILNYLQPIAVIETHVVAHRAFLDTLYAKDILLASGRQTPAVGGILIARGTIPRQELETLLKADPFYTEGVATYTIYEFTPNKYAAVLADSL